MVQSKRTAPYGAKRIAGMAGVSFGITNPTLAAAANGAASSAITQGLGVVTGLQDQFDWAGVGAGVAQVVSSSSVGTAISKSSTLAGDVVVSGASAIANAAARTLVNGSDFGDNLTAALLRRDCL
jgi:hypothetical protein